MAKLVRDIMRKGLITCLPETPLGEVAILLTQHHVHALIVANPTGDPLGVISDFDLLAGEWLSTDADTLATMKGLNAGNLMTSPIDSIEADLPITDAARIMLEKQVHRLMVTDNKKAIGVISIADLVATIAKQVEVKRDAVRDVMSDAFLVCRNNTPIIAAARTLTQTHWRSLIVLDEKGKPQGVLTGKDLLWHIEEEGVYEKLVVSDVMNHALTTIDVHASLHDAANLMIEKHQHRLIVIDKNETDGFPLGIIASTDIVAEMARPGSVWQG